MSQLLAKVLGKCRKEGDVNENLQEEHMTSTQPDIFTLTFRSLLETFIRRSLFNSSSGSCHDSDAT